MTFKEQRERVHGLLRIILPPGSHDGGPLLDDDEREALRAVLDQRDRLRTALDRVHGILQSDAVQGAELIAHFHGRPYTGDTFTLADYLEAISPETPVDLDDEEVELLQSGLNDLKHGRTKPLSEIERRLKTPAEESE